MTHLCSRCGRPWRENHCVLCSLEQKRHFSFWEYISNEMCEYYCQGECLDSSRRREQCIERDCPKIQSRPAEQLIEFLESLDCGDNSCYFKARGKGGMRTNGGCRCLKGLPRMLQIEILKWWKGEKTHDC